VEGGQAARLAVERDTNGLPTGLIRVALPRGEGNRDDSLTVIGSLRGGGVVGGEFGGLMRYAEGAELWLQRLDELALSYVRFGDPSRVEGSGDSADEWFSKRIDDGGSLAPLGAYDENDTFYPGMFRVDGSNNIDAEPGENILLARSLRPSLTLRSNMTTGLMVPWSKSSEPGSSVDQSFVMQVASGRSNLMREWSDWVSGVSSDLSKWRAEEASFTAVHQSLNEQREQISGVDLDQEATDLLRFQQIYQANSSVIQAAQRMFDVLINATGR